jgi:hypothetical protein
MSLRLNALTPRTLLIAAAMWILTPALLCHHPMTLIDAPGEMTASADPVVTITNSDQVYHPTRVKKGAKYKKPAVLTTSTIFDSIAEWKEIKKKKLTPKDAEYHLLLKKANEKFSCALKTVQLAGSYDIIAESGAISCKNCTATDVTSDMIAALP